MWFRNTLAGCEDTGLFWEKLVNYRSLLEETRWLGVTLALCVLRNTLAGSKNSASMCQNGAVLQESCHYARAHHPVRGEIHSLSRWIGSGHRRRAVVGIMMQCDVSNAVYPKNGDGAESEAKQQQKWKSARPEAWQLFMPT